MIDTEATPLLDKLQKQIEKELIAFHKTQKTGFYDFEPYFDDFYDNAHLFAEFIRENYKYKKGNSEAGVSSVGRFFRYAPTPSPNIHKIYGKKFIDIRCHTRVEDKHDIWTRYLYYLLYPDCIIRVGKSAQRTILYKKS